MSVTPFGPMRAVPKVPVSHVGAASNSATTGATASVTLPTVQNGDTAMFGVTTISTAVVATPAGCTLWATIESTSSGATLRVYSKALTAAESGTAINFTLSTTTNQSWCVVVSVYRAVGGFSTIPLVHQPHSTEPLNNRPPRFPSVYCGPDDMVVGFAGNIPVVSTAPAGAEMDVAPTGYTIRATVSRASNALNTPRGCTVVDAPGGTAPQHATFSFTQYSNSCDVIMVLCPATPRWAQIEKVPSTLVGRPGVVYSTSSSAYVKQPEANWGYLTQNPWGERIMGMLGGSANGRNMAMPGSAAEDICAAVHGTRNYSTRAVNGEVKSIVRAPTWNALPDTNALYVLDVAGNNVVSGVDSAKAQAGVTNAVRSIVRRIRCANGGAFVTSQNAGLVYAGTWTNGSSDGGTGGIFKQTTVPGSTMTYNVNNITGQAHPWDIVLIGWDGAEGTTGSTFTIKLDGVTVYTGTTNDQMRASGWGGGANYKYVQQVIPTVIPTGAHSLVLEHTGSSGHVLRVDAVQVPSLTPVWILNTVLPILPAAAYTTYPQLSLAKQATYAGLVQSVCNEFADGRVVFYDPSASGLLLPNSDYFASDDVHQTEMGHAHYAHEGMAYLLQRVP